MNDPSTRGAPEEHVLSPVSYVPDAIWRRWDFYDVFPLDGGGFFAFKKLVGATDDKRIAESVLSGRAFAIMRTAEGRIDWQRFDRWDNIETGVWANRWYVLGSVARMYHLTRDERHATTVVTLIDDWRAAVHPPEDYRRYYQTFRRGFDSGDRQTGERACATWCDFQLAQRLHIAYWVALLLAGSPAWTAEASANLASLMHLHGRLLHWGDREGKFEPGNHQMFRGFGLLHAAVMLPHAEEAAAWWTLGENLLTLHAERDFTSGGMNREASFSYQVFMLAQFAHATAMARATDRRAPDVWGRLIDKMARLVEATATPAGTTPVVNDGYEATVAPVLDICRLQVPELRAGDSVGGDPLTTFPEANLAVLSHDGLWILAEAMPPYGHSGHWHAGKPSLQVWASARPVLGDCGCPNYDDPDYGAWFRRAPAHLAVTVDGEEDAEFVSDVRWRRPPRLTMTSRENGPGVVFTSSGFEHLVAPVQYTREISVAGPAQVTIADRLRSAAAHTVALHVPFLTRDVVRESPNTFRARLGESQVIVRVTTSGNDARYEFTRKPAMVGNQRGDYPHLRVEITGEADVDFEVRLTLQPTSGDSG
jgi:heparinase II/III-like protein